MATKKDDGDVVKFTHKNGATVSVSADKAEALESNALFTRVGGRSSTKSASDG